MNVFDFFFFTISFCYISENQCIIECLSFFLYSASFYCATLHMKFTNKRSNRCQIFVWLSSLTLIASLYKTHPLVIILILLRIEIDLTYCRRALEVVFELSIRRHPFRCNTFVECFNLEEENCFRSMINNNNNSFWSDKL